MKAFSCPDCGASIKAGDFSTPTVECPYCNSSVVVPEELHPVPPTPPTVSTPRSNRRSDLTESPYFMGSMVFFIICAAIAITFVIIMRIVPSHDQKPAHLPDRSRPSVAKANIVTPTVALTFGNKGTGTGSFQNAHGVAVDAGGNIYVSDETLRIQKLDPAGKCLNTWTVPAAIGENPESGPGKLFTDGAGRVYAVSGGAVIRFDGASGKRLSTIKGADDFQDASLTPDGGLTLISWKDKKSQLVYLDSNGNEVNRIPGLVSQKIQSEITMLVSAMRLALDGRSNIFIVYALGTYNGEKQYDASPVAVYKFTSDGNYVDNFGLEGHGPDQLEMPTAIAIDNQNRIYVSEAMGDIKAFDDDGNYLMTLKTPHSVKAMAFDKDNNLYIVGSAKVSKLVLNK